MNCELCGSEGRLYKIKIEGTELNVCRSCAKHGKIISSIAEPLPETKQKKFLPKEEPQEEVIQIIVPDFSEKIRKKREQLNLNQKDFAKKLSEKESVIHKLETGVLEPSIKLAGKLEHLLGIKLIEEQTAAYQKAETTKTEEVTIGDLIKIKTRKKQ